MIDKKTNKCSLCEDKAEPESRKLLGRWLCTSHALPVVMTFVDQFNKALQEIDVGQFTESVSRIDRLFETHSIEKLN